MGASVNTTESHGTPQRIAGLDGLRGLAVTMVLGFHLYPRLVPGGWLGVSLFFTLSGFLITTMILRDLEKDTFSFKAFYARRVRRLLPAAILILTLFTCTWTLLGWFDEDHRTDVLLSFLQISNWQQIWQGVPYGTALASPVVHYWSLAIEEQAYLVLPLLIVLSGRTRLLKITFGLFVLSALATFLADGSQSIIYFGTHTRAAEVLTGVIAAAFLHNTAWRPKPEIATAVSLAGVGYLLWAVAFIHLKDNIVYSGGLLFTGAISAAVILALPHSRIAAFFDVRPFAWLGRVSYGVYLLHWPILLTLKRTDLPHWSVPLLTLALTMLGAMVIHSKFELPMRFTFTPRKVIAVLSVCVVLASGGFVFAKTPPVSFEDIEDDLNTAPDVVVSSNVPRMLLFGDSKMALFVKGLQNRIAYEPISRIKKDLFTMSGSFTRIGCPIGSLGSLVDDDIEKIVGDGCNWTVYDTETQPSEIAIIWGGTWDTADRKIPSLFGNTWVNLSDTGYNEWISKEYERLINHLKQNRGVQKIAIVNYIGEKLSYRQNDYTMFLEQFKNRPDVLVLDLVSFLKRQKISDYFPDGSHVSMGEPTSFSPTDDNSATDLYERWLEPALCAALLEKGPGLLTTTTCPEIDYSPRIVKK
jgi:peptidoglycan/LPS O-acetylase OafA/YrhL